MVGLAESFIGTASLKQALTSDAKAAYAVLRRGLNGGGNYSDLPEVMQARLKGKEWLPTSLSC